VFDQFLKRLEDREVLGTAAQKALSQSFREQKLDPETLRKAMFKAEEPPV
jgi:hypothetical protein